VGEKVRITIAPGLTWVERTTGMLGWRGDHETLQHILDELEDAEELP
jgi:hypothetical protein